MLSRRSLLKSTALAAGAAFATRVVSAAPAAEAATAALVEAATKEGKLAFYTAMDLQFAVCFKPQSCIQHQHIFRAEDGKRLDLHEQTAHGPLLQIVLPGIKWNKKLGLVDRKGTLR